MGWEAVTAISTAIIALAVVVTAFIGAGLLRDLARFTKSLERDARPVLDQARTVLQDANRASGKLTHEIQNMTEAASDVRERVLGAIDRVEDRLVDLDALLDVVQEEIEETVLDVGAALRTTRRGASILGAIRKVLGRGKKKRRGRRG